MKCRNCSADMTHVDGDMLACEFCGSRFHRSEVDPSWKAPGKDSAPVTEIHHHYHAQEKPDKLSSGLGCLIFFFFPLGWVIYFLNKDSSPRKARAALIIAAVMTVLMLIGLLTGDGSRRH